MKMRAFRVVLVVLCVVPLCSFADELEHKVKAEFIERFTRFVEWPGIADEPADEPFVIGVVGDGSLVAEHLGTIVADRPIAGRRAVLRRIEDLGEIRSCQLVYIAPSAMNDVSAILAQTENRPILTVGDTAGFCEQGVMINLYRERRHLRFEVNKRAVDGSGLHVSSNLLRLARIIEG